MNNSVCPRANVALSLRNVARNVAARHFQKDFGDNAIPRDTRRENISGRKYFFAGRKERERILRKNA